jgi:hypothetical protein
MSLTGDETGSSIEKLFSGICTASNRGGVRVRPIDRDPRGVIDIDLNDQSLGRNDVGDDWTTIVMPLAAPLHHSAPNTLTLRWHPAGEHCGMEVRDFSLR